jgi:predicted dehydrogenase
MSLKIGLVGAGSMGRNHARVISQSTSCSLAQVFDADPTRAELATRDFGGRVASDLSSLSDCDGVVIAATTGAHAGIANYFLDAGVPILLEKPLSGVAGEVDEILNMSKAKTVPMMCGFVERHNPALATALSILDEPVVHLYSCRHSPRNLRTFSSVIGDLLIHDLDLTCRIAPAANAAVHGNTWSPPGVAYPEIADCSIRYGTEMLAVQSASRWAQQKIREVRIATDSLLIDVDLLRVTVTVYRNKSQTGISERGVASYRSETVIDLPYVRHAGEPLAMQLEHFCSLIRQEVDADQERDSIAPPHALAFAVARSAGSGEQI